MRAGYFAYGMICYLMFLAVYAYMIGFVGNLVVPRSIDSDTSTAWPLAVAINLALMALFGLQHSIMARPTFKAWWTRWVDKPIERSTFVLLSNLCLIVLFWQWRGIDVVLWDVQHPIGRAALWTLFGSGWLLVVFATLLLNHFDLFGLRHVWLHLRGRPYTRLVFQAPFLYGRVRHPLYLGWLIAFWATPTMTVGHLLFAAGMSSYILIGIFFEERNLIQAHGRAYEEYRRRVPMLIPAPGRRYTAAESLPGVQPAAG